MVSSRESLSQRAKHRQTIGKSRKTKMGIFRNWDNHRSSPFCKAFHFVKLVRKFHFIPFCFISLASTGVDLGDLSARGISFPGTSGGVCWWILIQIFATGRCFAPAHVVVSMAALLDIKILHES